MSDRTHWRRALWVPCTDKKPMIPLPPSNSNEPSCTVLLAPLPVEDDKWRGSMLPNNAQMSKT
eukprot:1746925-Pyramimonas_sp.AAC.1